MVFRRKKQSYNEDTAYLLFDTIKVYSYTIIYCDNIIEEKKSQPVIFFLIHVLLKKHPPPSKISFSNYKKTFKRVGNFEKYN